MLLHNSSFGDDELDTLAYAFLCVHNVRIRSYGSVKFFGHRTLVCVAQQVPAERVSHCFRCMEVSVFAAVHHGRKENQLFAHYYSFVL